MELDSADDSSVLSSKRSASSGRRKRQADDMDCESELSVSVSRRAAAQQPRGQEREYCWLCTFCMHTKAKQMALFISEQSPHMDNAHIAEQVKDEILSEYPNAQGARKRDIIRHIQFHVLDPNVRLSTILRSLLSLAESVRLTMQVTDGETVSTDPRQVELYLRIISQIQNTYRNGGTRMLFSFADSLGASEFKAIGNG